MPEITGTITRDGAGTMRPCVWCGEGTDTLADTPGRPDIGRVPLHVWCAGAVIEAYRRLGQKRLLGDGGAAAKIVAYEARLAALAAPPVPVIRPINATETEIRYALDFLDAIVPTWRETIREEEEKRQREIVLRDPAYPGEVLRARPDGASGAAVDRERAKMRSRLEAFGAYTVVPHDDGCVGKSTGDMALCRCAPKRSLDG